MRTNLVLIIANACGYYFLAGVEVFGTEFAKDQYRINQALANLVLLALGAGAIGGVLAGGAAGDAARLDIMPPLLWGRAEAIRTVLRSLAQALAPLLFGGGRPGLQWTFTIMLVPLAASAALLHYALRTYPADVATAAAAPPPRAFHSTPTRSRYH